MTTQAPPKKLIPPPPPEKCPEFVSAPVRGVHQDFIKYAFELLLKKDLFWQNRKNEPPIRFRTPENLQKFINFELGDKGLSQLKLLTTLRKMIFYSANVAHPYFIYQLLAGLDPYAVVGDFVASALSTPMITYQDAPAFSLMEEEILSQVRTLIGYPNGEGDGIFVPGGSLSNCYAMAVARHHKFPETKEKGMLHLPPLVIYVSNRAHYSFAKGGFFEGFGTRNVVKVKTCDRGKMDVVELENEILKSLEKNEIPLMVGATAGTTIVGAFDPFEQIAEVCKKYGLWFHVDGAYGGGVIVSKNQRHRLKGVELSDSFTWNQHKMQSTCETCVTFVTRHKDLLKDTFGLGYTMDHVSPPRRESLMISLEELEIIRRRSNITVQQMESLRRRSSVNPEQMEYLQHIQEDVSDENLNWNTAEKHFQCSRRADVVKFWMMWKAKGLKVMGEHVDHVYENAKFVLEDLKRRQEIDGSFCPILEEFECTNVCFYYIPKYLQSRDRECDDFKKELSRHTSYLMAELTKKGIMLLVAQGFNSSHISSGKATPLFFKFVLHSSGLTKEDCKFLLDQLDNFGKDLELPPEDNTTSSDKNQTCGNDVQSPPN